VGNGNLKDDTMENLKDECDRALSLAQRITQDVVARIVEEFPDNGTQNASTITVFGYLSGVGERVLEAAPDARAKAVFDLLFKNAWALGNLCGCSPKSIDDIMQEARK
jgi:hypothetical protein